MATRDKQTQVEKFLADQIAHPGRPLMSDTPRGQGKATLLMLEDAPGALLMDASIMEAFEKKIIDREQHTLPEIRKALVELSILADVNAKCHMWTQSANYQAREWQRSTVALAGQLRSFLVDIDLKAEQSDHIAEKFPELAEDHDSTDLRAILEHGSALVNLMEAVTAEPVEIERDGTKPALREYFTAFERWWDEITIRPDIWSAQAVRNRLAAAAWRDHDRQIHSRDTDEGWARTQFKDLGKKPKNP